MHFFVTLAIPNLETENAGLPLEPHREKLQASSLAIKDKTSQIALPGNNGFSDERLY